jgi:hypothetical protein
MHGLFVPLAVLAAAMPGLAMPASGPVRATDVRYAKPAPWINASPLPSAAPDPTDAPLRVVYFDNQVRLGDAGMEAYLGWRMKVLKPEGLAIGNITLDWLPDSGEAIVHRLTIWRGGKAIDVLASTKFHVLQREEKLEQSMLSGQLTATLQVPGLQIGDEVEFAFTTVNRRPAFGDRFSEVAQLPVLGVPGAFRFRASWPDSRQTSWKATADLPPAAPTVANGFKEIVYEMRDPAGVVPITGAPPRFNLFRQIQFSDFPSWNALSAQYWTLIDKAAALPAGSPLHAEAARIAQSTSDPKARAQAALSLVQEQIRYVYVGLNDGAYVPAAADETWKRRFGDCKAKTVLLLALLRELGIAAEPVLVNSAGGDEIESRLPGVGTFDHILLRTQLGGKDYWLDGTRLGDRALDAIPPVPYRWVLPLGANGSPLQRVTPVAAPSPDVIGLVDIDASAGIEADAKVSMSTIIHGDDAYAMRSALAALPAGDAETQLRNYWQKEVDWVEPDKVAWRYEESQRTLVLTLQGVGKPDWSGDAASGFSYTIPGAGFYAPDYLRRPRAQNQEAPWLVEFPRFRCYATTIRLPKAPPKWRWSYSSKDMDVRLAGRAYWRGAGLKGDILRTVMSSRALVPELSASEASQANKGIPKFDNNMSSVYLTALSSGDVPTSTALPFGDTVDWVANPQPCWAPKEPGIVSISVVPTPK